MTIGSVDEDIMMMSTNTYVVGRPFVSSISIKHNPGAIDEKDPFTLRRIQFN